MNTAPRTTHHSSVTATATAKASVADGRKHKGSGFASWLTKKSTDSADTEAKKLASPAEEIKAVFLRQLELSSVDLNGKLYHSVFTGAQIVDIISKHFGLPDRTLATNVASRLIDCRLYTHVSGPSHNAQPTDSPAPCSKSSVVDSNTEIYTLTSEALSALKTMKGDTLQRAKTQTRRKYMDIRGHLAQRSSGSQETGNSKHNAAASSASGSIRTSMSGSMSSSSSSDAARAPATRNSLHLPSERRSPVPPPLDVFAAKSKVGAGFFRSRHSRLSSDIASADDSQARSAESPADTLVSHAVPRTVVSKVQPYQDRHYPSTSPAAAANRNDSDSCKDSDEGSQTARLQEVDIPTGDLGGLLNTWSFVTDGPASLAQSTRSSFVSVPSQVPDRGRLVREDCLDAKTTASELPAESTLTFACSTKGGPEESKERHVSEANNAESSGQRRWAMYRERSDGELNARRCHQQSSRRIRSYSSAPSLASVFEGTSLSRNGSLNRSSLPLPREKTPHFQMHSRPQSHPHIRDGWNSACVDDIDGDDMIFTAHRNSRYSDITVSSSYICTRPFNGALLERSFIFSEGSGDAWQMRSSTGSQFAEIQSSTADTEAETDGTSVYSSPQGMFVVDDEGKRQRALSDPSGVPRIAPIAERPKTELVQDSHHDVSRPNNGEAALAQRSLHSSRLVRKYVTPDPQGSVAECTSEDASGRASSVTLGSTMRHSESAVSEEGAMQLQLWRDTVPASLLQSLDSEAIARQEAIYELVVTEVAYLRDLELIDSVFVQPLLSAPHVMPKKQAVEFLHSLFFNYSDLIAISRSLHSRLRERQLNSSVVSGIGDIFDEWADSLAPFVKYAVHVPAAQCDLEAKLLSSSAVADFLAAAEAAPGARRLPVQSFLGRAATRLARYPLLIDAVLRRTQPGKDSDHLHSAAKKIRCALAEIDQQTGENAAGLRMRQINQRLRLAPGARESLALDSPMRRLIKEGLFTAGDGSQVLVFLFDNALVMAVEEKVPYAKNVTRYVADTRIIPVAMLDVLVPAAEAGALSGIREALGFLGPGQNGSARGALLRHSSSAASVRQSRTGAPLSFVHIGCRPLGRTLLAASDTERDSWLTTVRRRICVPQTLVEAYTELRLLSDRDFPQARGPQCSAPFTATSGCRMILFGNRDGLHLGIYGVPTSVVRVSSCGSVSKIHVLRRYNLAVVLSDQNLLVFQLTAIENATSKVGTAGLTGTRIASSVAFFDVGVYLGTPLIVLMKPRNGKSHFKCIQPQFVSTDGAGNTGSDFSYDSSESAADYKRQPAPTVSITTADSIRNLRTVYQGSQTALNLISEFSIPGKTKRVHFLRRKLCIVASKTFEIVDVANSRVLRSLPDPLDDDFSFVHTNDSGHAMAICKVGREFLLCYESFAFYIDNFGRRSRPDVFIRWEMAPHLITFRHPYVVAINPRFFEIRHMETGVLLSIVRLENAVCLNPDAKSVTLHIAVGPQPVGTATTILDNTATFISGDSPDARQAENDDSRSDRSDAKDEQQQQLVDEPTVVSAMPAPLGPSGNSAPRPMSTIIKSATTLGCPNVITGHVVPGLAGTSGKRLFPEGTALNYRIVEIRLPPLKHSAEQPSKAPSLSAVSAAAAGPKIASTSKQLTAVASTANDHLGPVAAEPTF
ncbi:RHO1 GDP-GTP exchange protein 2 [Coemansia sp. RSA 485]|nr:RHO1 GDP-GTP exchange protein 2 [Coemansia sp. RSA 485]